KKDLSDREKAWYFQLAAQLVYKGDPVEANNLQIKSNDLSTNMFHPQTTHMYKKMKHNIFQDALVRKMVESFSRPQDITLHIESLISNLQYNPEISSKDFENSLAKVGEFLGFNV